MWVGELNAFFLLVCVCCLFARTDHIAVAIQQSSEITAISQGYVDKSGLCAQPSRYSRVRTRNDLIFESCTHIVL